MWSFSLILVILGAVGISSYERKCSAHEDIKPCTCSDGLRGIMVKCTEDDLTVERLTGALQGLNEMKIASLWLRVPELEALPSTLFQGIDAEIKEVLIIDSKISRFSDGDRPFLGLENSLQKLEITESTIEGPIKLGHLQNLQKLILHNSVLPEINGDWFEDGIPSLQFVAIFSSMPRKIRSDAFAKLTNLKTLRIQTQTLEKLERSLLPNPAPALERLDFYKTETRDIAEDFFSNMPALTKIDINDNKISTIDERRFKPIWHQLEYADLEDNPIVCDSRLNWVLPVEENSPLEAICASPEELKGRKVGDLPDGKTKYDP